MERKIIRLHWDGELDRWVYNDPFEGSEKLSSYPLKKQALLNAANTCRWAWKHRGILCQLVVHTKDGRIQYERTYGNDPVRYEG